ncbi:hypothetical protein D9M71_662170 [compost metagenome]
MVGLFGLQQRLLQASVEALQFLLAGQQVGFSLFLLVNIGMNAGNLRRLALGIVAANVPAGENPAPFAIAPAQTVLGAIDEAAPRNVFLHAGQDPRLVLGVDQAVPCVVAIGQLIGSVTEHLQPARTEDHLVGDQVAIPVAELAGVDHPLQAGFAFLQLLAALQLVAFGPHRLRGGDED